MDGYCGIEQEENEIFVIEFSHAVSDPGTMMIHPLDAFFADSAMMYSRFFH